MTAFMREARLLFRSRAARLAVLLLALLASLAVSLGVAQIGRERAAIERIVALQADDEQS